MKCSSTRAIALAVAMALPGAALAESDTPASKAYSAPSGATSRYVIKLPQGVDAETMLETLRASDSRATLVRESSFAKGYAWFDMTDSAAASLRESGEVGLLAKDSALAVEAGDADARISSLQVSSSAADVPPLSDDAEAGAGVKVAVVSTGMDYTHSLLGGDGLAETYAEALANRAAEWDGFPTAVVTGGFDANSEDALFDPNPIEDALPDLDMSLFPSYPLGRGTLLGSIVHRLAPGAELLAYKIYSAESNGRGGLIGSYPDFETLDRAFAHIVDPNGDGDFSDRADIALIDTAGGLAFFDPYDHSESGDSLLINMVQALAAHGVLVVTDTGTHLPESRYTISWVGAAPDALTVGAMTEREDGSFAAAPFSARGPVRGPTATMKPDLVSYGSEIDGAMVGTGSEMTTETSNNVAAARIAAAAAILKSERPELSALDLKSLLANTAQSDILNNDSADAVDADVTYIGLGRENLDAAIAATALVRTESDHQPSVNFGFEEFSKPSTLVRRLVVRNLDDDDKSFMVSHDMRGEKPNHEALSLEYPSTVYVPANSQVAIDVAITVDPAKLAPWPLRSTEDYTDENWSSVQLNGYLTFSEVIGGDAVAAEASVAWMITPRAKTTIVQDFATMQELIPRWGEEPPPELDLAEGFASYGAVGYSMEFVNSGVADAGFAALPMITHQNEIPDNLKNSGGHKLRYLSGGVFPEASCTVTGQKLVMAVTMHEPVTVATANYFDKIGDALFTYSMIREQTVIDWGLDQGIDQDDLIYMSDTDYVTHGWVTINRDGKPVTIYIDMDLVYDPTNPEGRYRESTLPTYFAGESRNVISQVCVEDILHHRMTPEELNRNVGLVVGTDRMTLPEQFTPVIQFNPTRYGYVHQDCWEGDCWEDYNDGAKVTLEPVPAGGSPAFNPMLDIASGERAKLTAVKEDVCDGFSFFGPPPACNRRFVLMGMDGDFTLGSKVALGGEESVTAFVRDGQSFTIPENTETGTIVGRVDLEADGFFAIGDNPDSPWNDFYVYLANTLPGDPFTVNQYGDIIVNNSAAIDYEMNHSFTLQVRTRDGYDSSKASDVIVRLTNVNDVAPSFTGSFSDLSLAQGESIAIDIGSQVTDAEGDAVSLSVSGQPSGIDFDSATGVLAGSSTASGSHAVTVTASDGVNETTTSFTINISKNSGGGGSLGLWFLLALLVPRFAFSTTRR